MEGYNCSKCRSQMAEAKLVCKDGEWGRENCDDFKPFFKDNSAPVAKLQCSDGLFCPWCKEEVETKYNDDLEWEIGCNNPDCMIMPKAKGFETVEDAEYAWKYMAK